MQASVFWEHGLNFYGTARSGALLPLATSVSPSGDAFSPMELLLVGLAGCAAMDVISILQKKGQKVSQFEVRVQAQRAKAHPRVFTSADLEFRVVGQGVDPAAVERAIDLSTTRYCSAHAMLGKALPISHSYHVEELPAAPLPGATG